MARGKISQVEVLTWLKENHPALHEQAEIDREWVWITGDSLRPAHKKSSSGEHCQCDECAPIKAMRDSVNEYGFVFSRRGHTCPSGKQAWWGHACLKPLPFKRRGDGKSKSSANQQSETVSEAEALALLGF